MPWLLLFDNPRVGWFSFPILKFIPVGADLLSTDRKKKLFDFVLRYYDRIWFVIQNRINQYSSIKESFSCTLRWGLYLLVRFFCPDVSEMNMLVFIIHISQWKSFLKLREFRLFLFILKSKVFISSILIISTYFNFLPKKRFHDLSNILSLCVSNF